MFKYKPCAGAGGAHIALFLDENAFLKGQKVIEKHFEENQNFFQKITVKRLTTRTLNLLDYNY